MRLVRCRFKTADTGGFTVDTIVFPVDVERRVDQYVDHYRPVLLAQKKTIGAVVGAAAASTITAAAVGAMTAAAVDDDAMWLTKAGTPHTRLASDLQAIFQDTTDAKVNITTLRKAMATAALEFGTDKDRQLLAKNDKHGDSTTRTWYYQHRTHSRIVALVYHSCACMYACWNVICWRVRLYLQVREEGCVSDRQSGTAAPSESAGDGCCGQGRVCDIGGSSGRSSSGGTGCSGSGSSSQLAVGRRGVVECG